MYFQFVDGKPVGHPIRREELGRWLRETFGVDPILWRLFMAQWRGRQEARKTGRKAYSLSLWYFTPEENRAIPNFFQCVTDLMYRLMAAGAIEFNPEQRGDLIVTGLSELEQSSARPPWDLRIASDHDPLLHTGADPYIDRWITLTPGLGWGSSGSELPREARVTGPGSTGRELSGWAIRAAEKLMEQASERDQRRLMGFETGPREMLAGQLLQPVGERRNLRACHASQRVNQEPPCGGARTFFWPSRAPSSQRSLPLALLLRPSIRSPCRWTC